MRKKFAAVALGSVLALVVPAVSYAGGSDSPTPYDVTVDGVTLPEGEVFLAHGHINVRIDGVGYGIHFDPNNGHPGGAWIGESFIPWTAFGIESGCIEWVQIHGFNEHFGEGGQDPVCIDEPAPEPEPKPEPEEPGDETPDVPEVEEPETPDAPETDDPTTEPVVTKKTTTRETTNGSPVAEAPEPAIAEPTFTG